METRYRILNPREVASYAHVMIFRGPCQEGVPLVADIYYYEDDVFEKPAAMDQDHLDEWMKRGFVEVLE